MYSHAASSIPSLKRSESARQREKKFCCSCCSAGKPLQKEAVLTPFHTRNFILKKYNQMKAKSPEITYRIITTLLNQVEASQTTIYRPYSQSNPKPHPVNHPSQIKAALQKRSFYR